MKLEVGEIGSFYPQHQQGHAEWSHFSRVNTRRDFTDLQEISVGLNTTSQKKVYACIFVYSGCA